MPRREGGGIARQTGDRAGGGLGGEAAGKRLGEVGFAATVGEGEMRKKRNSSSNFPSL